MTPVICSVCKEEVYFDDEYTLFDINGEAVDNSEQALETNAQNPDYCSYALCSTCMVD